MEEDIKIKIQRLQNYIDDAGWELSHAQEELNELWDKLEENSNTVIKDINNLKRELKRDGLYSDKLEDFLENYMKYYNK